VRATESAEDRAARIQAQIDAREERERGYSLNGEQKARIAAAKAAARQALADAAAARKTEPKESA
jgi:CHASE3 domain sensor protein